MKRIQNKKGAIFIIVIVILTVIIIGVGYGTFRFLNRKSVLLPIIPSTQPTTSSQNLEINFTETGYISNWNSQTESSTKNWALLYEKPGNPVISIELVFNEASLCDLGKGEKVCDKSKFTNDDRTKIEGNKNEGKVTVINLIKL